MKNKEDLQKLRLTDEQFSDLVTEIREVMMKKHPSILLDDLAEVLLTILVSGAFSMFVTEQIKDETSRRSFELSLIGMLDKIWKNDIKILDEHYEELTNKAKELGKLSSQLETSSLDFENLEATKSEALELLKKFGFEPPTTKQ